MSEKTPYDRKVIVGRIRSESTTLLDRLLPALASLVCDSDRGPTPDYYELTVRSSMSGDPQRQEKIKRFMTFFTTMVGEDDMAEFKDIPSRVSYRIHPAYISIAITAQCAEAGQGNDYRTLVYNFTMTSLNKNAALSG